MKIKLIVTNALIAALYVVLTLIIQPFAFLVNQFRIPEILNHLIVFDRRYFFGIIIGVLIANLLFSPILHLDILYGVTHSIIALTITITLSKLFKNNSLKMAINTIIFSGLMIIIAYELNVAYSLPILETYLALIISEASVMALGIPIMYLVNKRIDFKTIFKNNG